eukprot:3482674-Pyramimonas_sp.AAC.1
MTEAVDPTAAAPEGHASDYSDALSIVTDVIYDADTPIDPRHTVTEDTDASPERWAVDRAGSIGWVRTRIKKRLSSNKYNLTAMGNGHYRQYGFQKA